MQRPTICCRIGSISVTDALPEFAKRCQACYLLIRGGLATTFPDASFAATRRLSGILRTCALIRSSTGKRTGRWVRHPSEPRSWRVEYPSGAGGLAHSSALSGCPSFPALNLFPANSTPASSSSINEPRPTTQPVGVPHGSRFPNRGSSCS
jgi:hypothetical protein